MNLKLPEPRQKFWTEQPNWERERIEAMKAVVNKNSLVVDIGAEQGDISAMFAQWGARVILIEPKEEVWPSIKTIFEMNNLKPPVMSFAGFACNERTDYDIHEFQALDGYPKCADWDYIADPGFRSLAEGNAPKNTLDYLLAGYKPTVLTMDVEGSEGEVIRGAIETIKKHKPIIFVSLHREAILRDYGMRADQFIHMIEELGYTSRFIHEDHEEHWEFMP